jgi:hypothetical protein
MNPGLNDSDPFVVAAFRSALVHQTVIALLIFALAGLAWAILRRWRPASARAAGAAGGGDSPAAASAEPGLPAVLSPAEPAWRRVLRIGFGLLWLFDGILQAQPKMAVGLPSQVVEPVAASSPRWVQHLVNLGGTTWSYHPMQAGASAVWIQVGIGLWLLLSARGPMSRLAGLASVGWGLVVWVFGESFGGIFAPGLTWLFGAPGAVLLYCVAGALIALPERAWHAPRLGRLVLAGLGLFLAGMAVLQAWPGRGFWQGIDGAQPGTLTGMIQSMATIPQPHSLSSLVTAFGNFTSGHGFAVNLVAVTTLALTGAAFLSGHPRLVRPALIAFTALCLADWVLIEDLGFLGGLGTDPNSMIPYVLLALAGYLALSQDPLLVPAPAVSAAGGRWRHLNVASARRAVTGAGARSAAAFGAIGVIALGAIPMAAAQANPVADSILAESINGIATPQNSPAQGFSLAGPGGRTVTLAGLRGKVVLLTFLDPVSVTDSTVIAQEFRQAGQLLAADSGRVELVAINDNPVFTQRAYLQAFDQQEGLSRVSNWLYLTGSGDQLMQLSVHFGLPTLLQPGGVAVSHPDYAFVIDQRGNLRWAYTFTPGPGTQSTRSSFAGELTTAARQLLSQG